MMCIPPKLTGKDPVRPMFDHIKELSNDWARKEVGTPWHPLLGAGRGTPHKVHTCMSNFSNYSI